MRFLQPFVPFRQSRTITIAVLVASTMCTLAAQTNERKIGDPDGQQLVVNADGSINYYESFGPALESRLEYRSKPRPTIDIYSRRPTEEQRVTLIDYDADGKPDFIHVEYTNAEGVTDMVGLYRGPMHKKHEEGHLDHALSHRFILGDSLSARQLRERLEAIRARVIPVTEIGVFSGYGLFAELQLPVIRDAFRAADDLSHAIAQVTNRPVNQLMRVPDIALEHPAEVQLLLSINPHDLSTDSNGSRPARPTADPEH